MSKRAFAVAGALAAAAVPLAVAAAPTAAACTGAIVQDATGVRCEDGPPPVGILIPAIGIEGGAGGPGIVTGPIFPGQTWNIPLG